MERTVSKSVRIVPALEGEDLENFRVSITPETVEVSGPASRVNALDSILTVPIAVSGAVALDETVDLDIPDPMVKVPRTSVQIQVRPQ
jgi:YbbR domain-containing protein